MCCWKYAPAEGALMRPDHTCAGTRQKSYRACESLLNHSVMRCVVASCWPRSSASELKRYVSMDALLGLVRVRTASISGAGRPPISSRLGEHAHGVRPVRAVACVLTGPSGPAFYNDASGSARAATVLRTGFSTRVRARANTDGENPPCVTLHLASP